MKPSAAMPNGVKRLLDQHLGAAIERPAVQDHLAGPHLCQDGGGDRRHAGREHQTLLGLLVDGEPILDDFEIGVIEAGIDEPRPSFRRRLAAPGGIVEESRPSSAVRNTKVEVRNTGGFTDPSESAGSYP